MNLIDIPVRTRVLLTSDRHDWLNERLAWSEMCMAARTDPATGWSVLDATQIHAVTEMLWASCHGSNAA